MSALNKEHIDDISHLSLKKSLLHRIPWLVIGLFGGIFAARIVNAFGSVLSEHFVLAAFIPLIVYMSDAVGTQMESFVIRDFAIHPRLNFIRYLLKQLVVVFIIGLLLGVVLFVYATFSHYGFRTSLALSLSLFFATISSVFTGLVLPLIFRRSKTDPANASGPIATVVQDILSVTIYLATAYLLLS